MRRPLPVSHLPGCPWSGEWQGPTEFQLGEWGGDPADTCPSWVVIGKPQAYNPLLSPIVCVRKLRPQVQEQGGPFGRELLVTLGARPQEVPIITFSPGGQ